MRALLFYCVVIIFAGCKAQNPPDLDEASAKQKQAVQKPTEIQYKRQSRGFRSIVSFNKDGITLYQNSETPRTVSYTKDDWEHLQRLSKNIDLSGLSSLKAPTDKRSYDGARAAELTLVVNETSWTSAGFDDGSPPKELSELVEQLVSLEEAYFKN